MHLERESARLSSVFVRQSHQPLVCLLFGFFSMPLEERETLERWLIDARALPLDSLPAWEDLGWDRGRQDAISASKNPCLKMTAGKRIRAIMPFSS